jgi:hypothetical protein
MAMQNNRNNSNKTANKPNPKRKKKSYWYTPNPPRGDNDDTRLLSHDFDPQRAIELLHKLGALPPKVDDNDNTGKAVKKQS